MSEEVSNIILILVKVCGYIYIIYIIIQAHTHIHLMGKHFNHCMFV